uniref:Uncharacterized protein n=1 Tax=Globisporangium ultimum (strain ATCC 200006 / CBS 805.95 / DAOM BR144) TaxID=431595 RepID=K3WW19_GLOUD
MDLSKILSPAVYEDDEFDNSNSNHVNHPQVHPHIATPQYAAPHPEERRRDRWSVDEMQCAVAILQDFHPTPSKARRGRQLGYQQDEEQKEDVHMGDQHEEKPSVLGGGSSNNSDLLSKLDLLVQADEMIQSTSNHPSAPSPSDAFVRSGVWTRAEEEYAAALIYYFLKGTLPDIKEGTTLRKFLAEQLCCNRRRVSMKLATESIAHKKIPRKVGASVFVAQQPPPSAREREDVVDTLAALRRECFDPQTTISIGSPDAENRHRQPARSANHELPELLTREPSFDTHRSPMKYSSQQHHAVVKQEPTGTPKKHKYTSSSSMGMRAPPLNGNVKRRKPTIIRTGFESVEEETYVTAMFEYFMAGVLEDVDEGTKLINYLCAQLACSPKTLSMKLAPRRLGERKFPDNLGSITYMHKASSASTNASVLFDRATVESHLAQLRFACFDIENTTPLPPLQPKNRDHHHNTHDHSSSHHHHHSHKKAERKHSNASNSSAPSPNRLLVFSRSGPWSREEEVYAASLIDCFFKGVLDIAEGTTLRAFLSSRLCCNPMRISKKLASEWIADIKIPKKLGSSTFVRRGSLTPVEHTEHEEALRKLQQAYLHSEASNSTGMIKEEDSVAVKKKTGRKHPRQEAVPQNNDNEEEEDSDEDNASEAAATNGEDEDDATEAASSSNDDDEEEEAEEDENKEEESSSDDDLESLGEKSPKKIRKVLANYSPRRSAAASPAPSSRSSTRRKLSNASSTSSYERVVPVAY